MAGMMSTIGRGVQLLVAMVIICAGVLSNAVLVVVADEATTSLRWDERHAQDYQMYRLLIKEGCCGARPSEGEYAGGNIPLKDRKREPALREVLAKYPDSEYADDAALLLARAKFLYHEDAEGAIEELYKVIAKYPDGDWIAEDPTWLQVIALRKPKTHRDPNDRLEHTDLFGYLEPREKGGPGWPVIAYFEYLEANPNKTADEAKYWIARIILWAELEDRYDEAVRNLREVVEAHRKYNRSAKDVAAVTRFPQDRYLRRAILDHRTEVKCHARLFETYMRWEDYAKAKETAEDFLSLHDGHPRCEYAHRTAAEACTRLGEFDEAIAHYENILNSALRIREVIKDIYREKIEELKAMR